jgi:hypothetical protein
MLCKATGIFMNFSVIFIWLFEGLKLKQFLKQLNRKKRKKRFRRRTELGRSRPSRPQSTRACAAHQEAQPLAAASSFPSLFLFLCFFSLTRGTPRQRVLICAYTFLFRFRVLKNSADLLRIFSKFLHLFIPHNLLFLFPLEPYSSTPSD